jgi:hypothetical protein
MRISQASCANRFAQKGGHAQNLLLHRADNRIRIPNMQMRVVAPVKYLHFYKVGDSQTVLTVVMLIGRVIVSFVFGWLRENVALKRLSSGAGFAKVLINKRDKWIWIRNEILDW